MYERVSFWLTLVTLALVASAIDPPAVPSRYVAYGTVTQGQTVTSQFHRWSDLDYNRSRTDVSNTVGGVQVFSFYDTLSTVQYFNSVLYGYGRCEGPVITHPVPMQCSPWQDMGAAQLDSGSAHRWMRSCAPQQNANASVVEQVWFAGGVPVQMVTSNVASGWTVTTVFASFSPLLNVDPAMFQLPAACSRAETYAAEAREEDGSFRLSAELASVLLRFPKL